MKKTKTCITYFLALLMLLVLVFPSCGLTVFADEATETVYSNVLDDLATDENFTIDDYPEDTTDYSLSMIQIAESFDGELFIYVYQPSGESIDLRASYLNMSQDESAESTTLYTLTYLNSSGTLYKYMVDNITLSSDTLRYYNITSIYRPTIDGVDETIAYEDQNITYTSYSVAQLWQAYTYNGSVLYSYYETEVITITDKYVGYVYYETNVAYGDGYDLHFVAFSTDRDIDTLYSAKVYYTSQTITPISAYSYSYGDIEENIADLSYTNKISVSTSNGYSFKRYTYEWDTIQTVSDFVENVELDNVYSIGLFDVTVRNVIDEDGLSDLNKQSWVLSFCLTEYSYHSFQSTMLTYTRYGYTVIGDVSILELTFETDGITYSLGVVDNMQSEADSPINDVETDYDWADWLQALVEWLQNNWQYIVIGIVCVVVLIIIVPFIPSILSFLVQVVRWLIKGIWKLIQLCAKGIAYLVTSVIEAVDSITK